MYFRTWRNGAREREREREKSFAAYRTRTFIPSVIDLTAIHTNGFQVVEDNSETEDAELIPRQVRRQRRRRVTPSITMVNNG
jgi:hypothetical protein